MVPGRESASLRDVSTAIKALWQVQVCALELTQFRRKHRNCRESKAVSKALVENEGLLHILKHRITFMEDKMNAVLVFCVMLSCCHL